MLLTNRTVTETSTAGVRRAGRTAPPSWRAVPVTQLPMVRVPVAGMPTTSADVPYAADRATCGVHHAHAVICHRTERLEVGYAAAPTSIKPFGSLRSREPSP